VFPDEASADHQMSRSLVPTSREWRMDPTDLALKGTTKRQKNPEGQKDQVGQREEESWDPSFCAELGRRILLAELEFSQWVLRRVEKVSLESDRCVTRRVSVELNIREDAPIFVDRAGNRFWLVPLSMMGRHPVLNLDIRDEQGERITTPGIRLSQQLDQSILLAAAAASTSTSLATDQRRSDLRQFIEAVIAGELHKVKEKMEIFEGNDPARPEVLRLLADDWLFTTALQRLRNTFTLYVFLPVKPRGPHRLLQMSFDRPISHWSYHLREGFAEAADGLVYDPGQPVARHEKSHLAAALGLTPTRMRFQVPAAENTASYRFEMSAPSGTRIVGASLLAGRPNDPTLQVSADHGDRHSTLISLHAVEIPNGSLCRAQVDLRVSTQGWWATMVFSCWLIFSVLATLLIHLYVQSPQLVADQVTNLVVLLVTTSAGVVALLAQRDFGAVAARLLTPMMAMAAAEIALPIVTAGVLTYESRAKDGRLPSSATVWVVMICLISLVIVGFATTAWFRTRNDERNSRSASELSPWDQTTDGKRTKFGSFSQATKELGFDTPAMVFWSPEGWHEQFRWTQPAQREAVEALGISAEESEQKPHGPSCKDLGTSCTRADGCPTAPSFGLLGVDR
jgi:hypothetical protein